MARELDVVASVQTAEATLTNEHVTLGFDATTQEGVHINSIHVTTRADCYVIAVDELPGGTALDSSSHNLSRIYGPFTATSQQQCRLKLISNISNCMMDKGGSEPCSDCRRQWGMGQDLNRAELPSPSTGHYSQRSQSLVKTTRRCKGQAVRQRLHGKESGKLQLNKLRYKDGKGYPRGFKAFLDAQHLPPATCHVVLCRAPGGTAFTSCSTSAVVTSRNTTQSSDSWRVALSPAVAWLPRLQTILPAQQQSVSCKYLACLASCLRGRGCASFTLLLTPRQATWTASTSRETRSQPWSRPWRTHAGSYRRLVTSLVVGLTKAAMRHFMHWCRHLTMQSSSRRWWRRSWPLPSPCWSDSIRSTLLSMSQRYLPRKHDRPACTTSTQKRLWVCFPLFRRRRRMPLSATSLQWWRPSTTERLTI